VDDARPFPLYTVYDAPCVQVMHNFGCTRSIDSCGERIRGLDGLAAKRDHRYFNK